MIEVLRAIDQITIVYRNQRATTGAETRTFGPDGQDHAVHVTYGETPR